MSVPLTPCFPSALAMSDSFRLLRVGRSRFGRCRHLFIALRFCFRRVEPEPRRLTQSWGFGYLGLALRANRIQRREDLLKIDFLPGWHGGYDSMSTVSSFFLSLARIRNGLNSRSDTTVVEQSQAVLAKTLKRPQLVFRYAILSQEFPPLLEGGRITHCRFTKVYTSRVPSTSAKVSQPKSQLCSTFDF